MCANGAVATPPGKGGFNHAAPGGDQVGAHQRLLLAGRKFGEAEADIGFNNVPAPAQGSAGNPADGPANGLLKGKRQAGADTQQGQHEPGWPVTRVNGRISHQGPCRAEAAQWRECSKVIAFLIVRGGGKSTAALWPDYRVGGQ